MAILFSGDFHLNQFNRIGDITKNTLQKKYKEFYSKIKYHIMLGDTGFLQPGRKNADHKYFELLAMRPSLFYAYWAMMILFTAG